jgi:hypothetical protein
MDVRAMSGADGKRRSVSLSTACTVRVQCVRCAAVEVNARQRTVLHLLEVLIGGCAGETESFEDFFPETTTRVWICRKEVYHKRQEGGCLGV